MMDEVEIIDRILPMMYWNDYAIVEMCDLEPDNRDTRLQLIMMKPTAIPAAKAIRNKDNTETHSRSRLVNHNPWSLPIKIPTAAILPVKAIRHGSPTKTPIQSR